MTFVCPVTLKIARCGKDGKGFPVKLARESVAKAAPYLLAGYEALRWACFAGRLGGLPLPPDQALAVEKFPLLVERLQGALEEINDDQVSAARSKRVQKLMEECASQTAPAADQSVKAPQAQLLKDFAEDARAFVREVLSKIPNWTKTCGLVHVTAEDGASEWVHPDGGKEKFLKAHKGNAGTRSTGSAAPPRPQSPPGQPRKKQRTP